MPQEILHGADVRAGFQQVKKKIADAQSFDSLIEVYRWMKTDHSYEEEKTADPDI